MTAGTTNIHGLPAGWSTTSLGELVVSRVAQVGPQGATFRYVDIGSVDRVAKRISAAEVMDSKEAPSRARQVVAAGDVLVSMTRPNLNSVAMAADEHDGSIASTGFDVLRSISVEPGWIFAHVKSASFVAEMSSLVRGALYPAVASNQVRASQLVVPPLPEQRRILDQMILLQSRSSSAADALNEVGPLLDKFRQSVLAAAFRGDLTKAWREANPDVEPASMLLERVRTERRQKWQEANPKKAYVEPGHVNSGALPEVPDGWCWARLSDCGEVARGKSKHRPRNDPRLFGDEYPFIQTGEVARSDGRISGSEVFYSDFGLAQSRLFPVGTVCITIAANIADTAVLTIPACFPDSVVGVVPDAGLASSEYLEFYIRTIRNDLEAFAPATAQKNINLEVLNQVAVPIPPAEERAAIERILTGAIDYILEIRDRLAGLARANTTLNQSILAKAFRGELVPQDPNDEPASVLLDRIRAERAAAPIKKQRRTKHT